MSNKDKQAQIESDFVTNHLKKNKRMPTFIDAIEYGMKLKEKEMQATIELAEEHAMLAGMNKMEQQMMAKAVDGQVYREYMQDGISVAYGVEVNLDEHKHDFSDGERVKLIIIKEDQT